eukprot:11108513-Alexandrium_andersonii.AAC.1
MSASLVGSEMCIRDSTRTEVWLHLLRDTPHEVLRVLRDSSRPMWTTKAVSYTHLTLPTICSV